MWLFCFCGFFKLEYSTSLRLHSLSIVFCAMNIEQVSVMSALSKKMICNSRRNTEDQGQSGREGTVPALLKS